MSATIDEYNGGTYRGYTVSPRTKIVHKHNPISGHRWAEAVKVGGFTVSGKNSMLAPHFKNVRTACNWIDKQIDFDEKFPYSGD